MNVLVGYATREGSTRGVAERVADVLAGQGYEARLRALGEAVDVGGFDAFVLGSAVHKGDWLPEAAAFLRANEAVLAAHPVWLFSVGLARVLGGRFEKAAKDPRAVAAELPVVRPREHRHLAGAVEPYHFPRVGRVVFRLVGGRWGDHRDWAEIGMWSQHIADELREAGHGPGRDRRGAVPPGPGRGRPGPAPGSGGPGRDGPVGRTPT